MKGLRIIFALLLTIALAACQKREVEALDGDDGDYILTPIELVVGAQEIGNAEAARSQADSRSTAVSTVVDEIRNVWFFQVSSSDNMIVAPPTYVSDYKSSDYQDRYVKVANERGDFRFIYLANSFDPALCQTNNIRKGSSLTDLLALSKRMSGDMSCFGTDGDHHYPILTGDKEQTGFRPDKPCLTACTVYRCFAEVTMVIVDVPDATVDIEFYRGVLAGVQSEINYFAYLSEHNPSDENQALSESTTASYTFTPKDFILNWPVDGQSHELTFNYYVPVNRRGENTNSDVRKKPTFNNAKGATFFQLICAEAPKIEAQPSGLRASSDYVIKKRDVLDFKFYLGANLENNYNVKANTRYHYRVEYKTLSDDDDPRRTKSIVKEMPTEKLSNCYIVNPDCGGSDHENPEKKFYSYLCIPTKGRIKEFWTQYATVSEQKDESEIDNIFNNNQWKIEVLWYDCKNNPFSQNATPENKVYYGKYIDPASDRVSIGVDPAFNNWGNVVLGIKHNDEVLWSWHFWLTDYNPYVLASDGSEPIGTGSTRAYSINVRNGELHHYKDRNGTLQTPLWNEEGEYDKRLIMDRNIGAIAPDYAGHGGDSHGKGRLYYQFGRKDPFPGDAGIFPQWELSYLPANGGVSFAEGVANPTTIYYGGEGNNWSNDPSATRQDYLWNDKKAPSDTKSLQKKSIFDPSPWCFMIPRHDTYTDFPVIGNFSFDAGGKYRMYRSENNEIAKYPIVYFRSFEDGLLRKTVHSGTLLWTATPSGSDQAHRLDYQSNIVLVNSNSPKAAAFSIRPIQEE